MELVISKSGMASKNSISVDSLRCYSVVLETAAAEYKRMNAKGDAMRPKICIKCNKHGCSSVSSTNNCRCLAYFEPILTKKVHLTSKISLFLTFMLINFLLQTILCNVQKL
jgi:hypothetical protein